ncbi:MAG: hypothetical protein JSV86_02475 [Gemmatimonadota bacterium]|nr:MAG: hypothetical protein JSV86_02475 [Gemmatimonadota bacterium]
MARTHFEQKLDDLTGRLVAMSRMIEVLIEKALEALRERDVSKAEAVILGDRAGNAARCPRFLRAT